MEIYASFCNVLSYEASQLHNPQMVEIPELDISPVQHTPWRSTQPSISFDKLLVLRYVMVCSAFKHAGQLSLTRPINLQKGKKRTEGEIKEWGGSLVSDYTLYRFPSLLVAAGLPSDCGLPPPSHDNLNLQYRYPLRAAAACAASRSAAR